jgi:hypothetical protein
MMDVEDRGFVRLVKLLVSASQMIKATEVENMNTGHTAILHLYTAIHLGIRDPHSSCPFHLFSIYDSGGNFRKKL